MSTFHIVLLRLRKRYIGKQLALATSLGCTEAAISFWEHGRRLPLEALVPRIVECFRGNGAHAAELEELQQAYDHRRSNRHSNKGEF
jgi:transcriptional regulator with XRE-family HTH domain